MNIFKIDKVRSARNFGNCQAGAVTVDWVVLTAALAIIGGMIVNIVKEGTVNASGAISGSLTTAANALLRNSPSNPLSYAEYVAETGNDFLANLTLEEIAALTTLQEGLATIPLDGGSGTDPSTGMNYSLSAPVTLGGTDVSWVVSEFDATDFNDNDVAWADGYFVRWPDGSF